MYIHRIPSQTITMPLSVIVTISPTLLVLLVNNPRILEPDSSQQLQALQQQLQRKRKKKRGRKNCFLFELVACLPCWRCFPVILVTLLAGARHKNDHQVFMIAAEHVIQAELYCHTTANTLIGTTIFFFGAISTCNTLSCNTIDYCRKQQQVCYSGYTQGAAW